MKKVFALLVLASLALAGCRNETTDEYKSDLLQKNLGQIQGVQGSYSGMLVSNKDHSELGGLKITLKSSEQVVGSGDENKSSATPILTANIEFAGPNSLHLMIAAQDSYYDPQTGLFTADIKVNSTPDTLSGAGTGSGSGNNGSANSGGNSSNTQTIAINGLIHDGVIDGQIAAVSYDNYGGSFRLALNGPDLSELAQQAQPNPNLNFMQNNYMGTATFQNGVQKPVNLVLLKPSTTSEEDFLNILLPVKPVIATFNYGNGSLLSYPNASWDQQTGRIAGGTAAFATAISQISLLCEKRGEGFDCTQTTTGVIGVIASIHVDPVQGPLPEPQDSPAGRAAITHIYTGDFTSSSGDLQTKVTITYPARTRNQEIGDLYFPASEKTLIFSFAIIPDMTVGATFTSTTWDKINKTLVGQQASAPNANLSYQMYLSCQNFDFMADPAQGYDFSCSYLSTLRNENQTIHLHSK